MTAAAQTVEAPAWLTAFYAKVDALDTEGVLDGFSPEEQAVIEVYLDRVLSAYRNHIPSDET